MTYQTLYCAINWQQLQQLIAEDWRRLGANDEQCFLLFKTTMLSAASMAEQWIARHEGVGFVVTLSCDNEYLASLDSARIVSDADYEYRLPCAALPAFHREIRGRFELVAAYGVAMSAAA